MESKEGKQPNRLIINQIFFEMPGGRCPSE